MPDFIGTNFHVKHSNSDFLVCLLIIHLLGQFDFEIQSCLFFFLFIPVRVYEERDRDSQKPSKPLIADSSTLTHAEPGRTDARATC